LELNLQIVELWLKEQPSTPSEVREQHHRAIQSGLEVIEHVVQEFMGLLDQSLFTITSLQEDPTIQNLEIESW